MQDLIAALHLCREDALLALPTHLSEAQSLSRLEPNSRSSKAFSCLPEYLEIDESILRRPYVEVPLVAFIAVRQRPQRNHYTQFPKHDTPKSDSAGENPVKITTEDSLTDTSESAGSQSDEIEETENDDPWMYPTDPRWTGPSDTTETSAKRDPDVCDPGILSGPEADTVDDASVIPTAAHCFFKVPLRGTYRSCRLPVLIAGSSSVLVPAIVSVLYQRHTWGLEDPVVGVLYSPDSPRIMFVLGWYKHDKNGLVDEPKNVVSDPLFLFQLVSSIR